MEHRNGNRVAIKLPVELLRCGRSFGRFMSHNIGRGGLQVNCRGALKKGDFLTAKIAKKAVSQRQAKTAKGSQIKTAKGSQTETAKGFDGNYYQMKVIVIHCSVDGVGLMWVDGDIPFFHTLDRLFSTAA